MPLSLSKYPDFALHHLSTCNLLICSPDICSAMACRNVRLLQRLCFKTDKQFHVSAGLLNVIQGSQKRSKPFPVLDLQEISPETIQDNKNAYRTYTQKFEEILKISNAGGGEKAIARHVKQHRKLLPRDRINLLLDNEKEFLELSTIAGYKMEYGDVPKASVLTGWVYQCICLTIRQYFRPPDIKECVFEKYFSYFSTKTCCGYTKELSQWDGSFEHPKQMFKFMGKEKNAILGAQSQCFNRLSILVYLLYFRLMGSILGNASCAPCLLELCLSSRFLNELTVLAEIASSGNLFQEFTTRILKKFDLCKIPLFSLGLYSFWELSLVLLLKSLPAILKNLSHFTFSFLLIVWLQVFPLYLDQF